MKNECGCEDSGEWFFTEEEIIARKKENDKFCEILFAIAEISN